MKMLYASDYDSQKDIKLPFYDLQRKKYNDVEKDGKYSKGYYQVKNESFRIS